MTSALNLNCGIEIASVVLLLPTQLANHPLLIRNLFSHRHAASIIAEAYCESPFLTTAFLDNRSYLLQTT